MSEAIRIAGEFMSAVVLMALGLSLVGCTWLNFMLGEEQYARKQRWS